MYKLGARPGIPDKRTLKLKAVMLDVLPEIPDNFDLDTPLSLKDNFMFGNDKWGCCVIAARAHMTLRFEAYEQEEQLPISTGDVLAEYWKEQGGNGICSRPDNGLVMLDSLKAWSKSWKCAGDKYKIYAYGQIDWKDHKEVKACLYLLNGAYIGLALPMSAQSQAIWDVANTQDGTPASWGHHCVYLPPKARDNLSCWTWGKEQLMTWAFLDKYCFEAWGVVDDKNGVKAKRILDTAKLEAYLNALKN